MQTTGDRKRHDIIEMGRGWTARALLSHFKAFRLYFEDKRRHCPCFSLTINFFKFR